MGRLVLVGGALPVVCLVAFAVLLIATSRRLLHPPDVGADAKEAVDSQRKTAVGILVRINRIPDMFSHLPSAMI